MSKSNEKLVQNTLKTLEKEFVVVGKTRVRSWHAWLAIGIAVGISAGILYVANRSGEFESGSAQVVPPATTSYTLTIGKTPLATVGLGRTATNKRVDQSFIAPTDLPLQSVKLALTQKGIPTQQITVSIRETRSGPDLTSALLTPIAIPTSAPLSLAEAESSEPAQPTYIQSMVATFKSPITLTPERKYFLVLTADTVNYNNFYRVAVDNTNPYAGGNVVVGATARPGLDAIATLTFSKPSITVLSPNGGEVWQVGATHTINYKPSFTNDSTLIYLDRYHPAGAGKTGINSTMLIGETASGVSSFPYTVPEIVTKWPGLGSEYKIRVCIKNSNCTVSDSSDAYFSIVAPQPSITVLSPNGGEVFARGGSMGISWSPFSESFDCIPGTVCPPPVDITLWTPLCEPGTQCLIKQTQVATIASQIQDTGSFKWLVGGQFPDGEYVVKVSNGKYSDQSDNPFSITNFNQ